MRALDFAGEGMSMKCANPGREWWKCERLFDASPRRRFSTRTRLNHARRVKQGLSQSLKERIAKLPLALFHIVTIVVTVMANNIQFSIAIHIMAALACGCDRDVTSGDLAMSVNTSPSFVRRVVAKLSKAGLVETATGKAGKCWLARDPKKISLLDIYRAVDAPRAFAIHDYAEQKACPVSCHIKSALDKALAQTQEAMESSLDEMSLAKVVAEVRKT
jgi:Rrf2 family protein